MSKLSEQNTPSTTQQVAGQAPSSDAKPASQQGAPQTPPKDAIKEKASVQQNPTRGAINTPMSATKGTSEGSNPQPQQALPVDKR